MVRKTINNIEGGGGWGVGWVGGWGVGGGGGTLITIYVQDLGFIFGGRCVSVTNIAEMGLNGFSWFFRV